MKRLIEIEDEHDKHLVWLPDSTEGITMDASRGFKWLCLVAILVTVYLVFKAIWG